MRVRPLFRRVVPVAIGATAMTVMGFGAGALVSASESTPPLALCINKVLGTVSAPESGKCPPAATTVEVATQAGLDEALSVLAAQGARLDTVESAVSGLERRVIVSVDSASSGRVANAAAYCPSGSAVTGGGAMFMNGLGDGSGNGPRIVINTPSLDGVAWAASAIAPSTFTAQFTLRATAICAPGATNAG